MTIKINISEDRIKLSQWMKKNYPSLSMVHLQKLCRIGEIRIDGRRVSAHEPMEMGNELKLPPYIEEYKAQKGAHRYNDADMESFRGWIIYEDDEILAINKPAGMASQGGTGIDKSIDTLANIAMPEYGGNLRIVHRLDQETSGVMIIAKGYDAAKAMADLFKERDVEKTYVAFVYGRISTPESVIRLPVMETAERMVVSRAHGSKRAVTAYKVMDEAYGQLSFVRLMPETGRTHQLRLHMAHIGNPIVGDFKYGRQGEFARLKEAMDIERQLYLHSHTIQLPGRPAIDAPMPEHFQKVCKFLNFGMKK